MSETPTVTQSPAQRTAVIRVTVPRDRIAEVMDPGVHELFRTVQAQGVAVTGPWFTYHYRRPTDSFDLDIGVPVASPVRPEGRVRPGELRRARVARMVHEGPYAGLSAAWERLGRWIADQGYVPADDLWEFYEVGPESGPDASRYRTVLVRPLLD